MTPDLIKPYHLLNTSFINADQVLIEQITFYPNLKFKLKPWV